MPSEWMIYGANGYSAQLAAEKAASGGLKPVLAGRNKAAIEALAARLDLPCRVFDLSDVDHVAEQLADISVVSHCAGPFSATAESMVQACIKAKTHYTDITGEIPVFDMAQSYHEQAKAAGVVLCGGVGFDIIPTDCLSALLHSKLPDATELTLGFSGNMKMSPGTTKTMIESLHEGMKVRRNGELIEVGMAFEMRDIDFGKGERPAAVIPWGDLSTAYWATGIPNITVYMPMRGSKLSAYLFPVVKQVLKSKWVQDKAKAKAGAGTGPSADQRAKNRIHVWGEVKNATGKIVTGRLQTPDGYTVTMDGIIMTAQFLGSYQREGGYFTPSQLMGHELAEQLPGAGKFEIEEA